MTNTNPASRIVGAVILIVVGVLLLVGQGMHGNIWNMGWPFIVIAVGGALFAAMVARGRGQGGALAVGGSIVTTAGAILFVENNLRFHEVWTYGWPLMVIAIGVGMIIRDTWNNQPGALRAGGIVALVGIVLLGVNSVANLGRIFNWVNGGEIVGGVLLVLGGLALLFSRRRTEAAPVEKAEQVR